MIKNLIARWRQARAQKAAERQALEARFRDFLAQTLPLVPEAPKHPNAALYRHAWKRAHVLAILHQRLSDSAKTSLYKALGDLAAAHYYKVAPEGPYGRIQLKIEAKAAKRLLDEEIRRLLPPTPKRVQQLACIYLGKDKMGSIYIGQTVDAPERRWKEHRLAQTGPFKKGADYVEWKVIHGPVPELQLDELESYYIGYYDAIERGHNEGKGNDWRAYNRGCTDRMANRAPSHSSGSAAKEKS